MTFTIATDNMHNTDVKGTHFPSSYFHQFYRWRWSLWFENKRLKPRTWDIVHLLVKKLCLHILIDLTTNFLLLHEVYYA